MSKIHSIGAKVLGSLSDSKPVKWNCNNFKKNFDDTLVYTTIASIVLKDGVGCAMYVKQSLDNKEIPEKRRNFVAALDLTNGILMITAQIALFLAMHKLNKPLFDKLFSKSFSKDARKSLMTQTRMIQRAEGDKLGINNTSKKLVVGHAFDNVKKSSLKVFEFVTDLVASTIIAKRVIVPLIATPLASIVEKKMNASHEGQNPSEKEIKDKSNPTMQGVKTVPTQTAEINKQESTNLLNRFKK